MGKTLPTRSSRNSVRLNPAEKSPQRRAHKGLFALAYMSLWPQRVSRLDEYQGRAASPPHCALHLVAGAPSESTRSRCHDPKIVRHLGSDQRFGLGSRSSASARRFFTRCESHHSEWLVERPRMLACALHDAVSRSTWTHRIKDQSGRRRGSRGSDLIFGVSNVMRRRKEWLSLHGANIAARPKARRLDLRVSSLPTFYVPLRSDDINLK